MNTPQPLRNAKLIVHGHRKDDGQRVAVFDQAGELVEYDVYVGRAPVRLPEAI